eukprot:Nitzschia sp. Nitz4//scaffold60_size111251//53330//56192//NITZ4_004150-RA/size111251-augustus-gene-0.122-mRNA-1//-1//CDS//3329555573//7305//frame0
MSSTTRKDDIKERKSITILVLGDEGVGKSSLISTFVSRHFSEVVPGIMTRVRLPPDPDNACMTTIVDSQGGDAALMSAVATLATTTTTTTTATATAPTTGATATTPSNATTTTTSATANHHQAMESGGAAALTGIENIDSIILVYDLDRDETFFRLENHWLPLIERCYNGGMPVIVAGNKMDLFLPSSTAGVTDEQVLARSRQQIVTLMQRFRFIRQCIKCSAKNLLRVDELFIKAQQALLYPFNPLYDLDSGRLSEECKRAFTRIFRIYDRDNDGLLSHQELDRLQYETFHVPIYERDLTGWKKVVTRNNPNEEVVRDGKFTVAGFLAIFDVFISQNRLDVPWQALRKFGYDDNLVLHVPDSVIQFGSSSETKGSTSSGASKPSLYGERPWSLPSSARQFLSDVFHQFDSDHDGVLSITDIQNIFSIVSDPSLPPWHPLRAHAEFDTCFSLPFMPFDPASPDSSNASQGGGTTSSQLSMAQSLSASGITIVSGETFPSVDISAVSGSYSSVVSKPLSFLDWMGLWHALSAISPSRTRAELFRLGHLETKRSKKSRRGKKKSGLATDVSPDANLPSREVRALLLGSPGSGKTALLNALGHHSHEPLVTTKTKSPVTHSTYVKLKRRSAKAKGDERDEPFVVHLVATEVPEAEAEHQAQRRNELRTILSTGGCDLVILAFDSTNSASLAYAQHLEHSLLTDDISRVYVGTKSDQCKPSTESGDDSPSVIEEATNHCRELDLEPPLVTSAGESMLGGKGDYGDVQRQNIMEHLSRCVISEAGVSRLRAKPHEERKRQEAAQRRNRKMIWFGVSVGVAVAVVGYLIAGATSTGSSTKERENGMKGPRPFRWLHTLFGATGPTTDSM